MKQFGAILAGVLAVLLIAGVASAVVSVGTNSSPDVVAIGSDDPGASATTSTTMDEPAEREMVTSTTMTDDGDDAVTDAEQDQAAANAIRTIDADGAGTLMVAAANGTVIVTTVDPAEGWTSRVEQREQTEAEIRFENGDSRVTVKAEVDDGRLRIEIERRNATSSGDENGTADDDHGTYDDDHASSSDDDFHGTYDDESGSSSDDDQGTYDDDNGSSDDGNGSSNDEDDDSNDDHGEDDHDGSDKDPSDG